jgi:hypothetical protein
MTSLTIKVNALVLVHARMRALLDGTSVSRLIRAYLEEYAKESLTRFLADPAGFGRHPNG